MKTFSTVAASFTLAFAVLAAGDEAGFKPLFNGKNLDDWEGNPKLWSVQDGAITGKTGEDAETKIKHNTFLVWKGDVGDFELRLQYRIVANNTVGFANSGIQYRSKVVQHGDFGPIVGGYQADFEAAKTYSGILYEERGRGILAKRGEKVVVKPGDGKKPKIEVVGSLGKSEDIQAKIKKEDWNDYVVIAKGNHLQHFINGQQTVDVVDEDEANGTKSGVLALQIHVGQPMTVQFRNIRLKELRVAKTDLEKMQGDWRPVEIVANGERLDDDALAPIKLHISGNDYTVQTKDGEDGGSFQLDETQTPGRIDVVTKKGDQVPAIYEFPADGSMRVCYALGGGLRPVEFKSHSDTGHVFAVYRHEP
jgi:uncharacterized protein (TIGR03067 family)